MSCSPARLRPSAEAASAPTLRSKAPLDVSLRGCTCEPVSGSLNLVELTERESTAFSEVSCSLVLKGPSITLSVMGPMLEQIRRVHSAELVLWTV